MNRLERLIISIMAFFFLVSCNSLLYGELKREWKKRFETVENRYSEEFLLENIPCENYYLNIHVKGNRVDTTSIKEAHKILYDRKSKVGWMSLHVFNSDGKFLFTHTYEGRISTAKPNW